MIPRVAFLLIAVFWVAMNVLLWRAEYVQGGTRYTAPARTEDGAPVSAGKPVRITRVVGTQYFVQEN